MLAVNLLRGGRPKLLFEVYLIKAVRYLFLADVVFLFTVLQAGHILVLNDLLIAGLILLIYFVGKIQSKQHRQSFFSVRGQANIPGMGDLACPLTEKKDCRCCRSEEHTSELQSRPHLVCRLLLEKKKK